MSKVFGYPHGKCTAKRRFLLQIEKCLAYTFLLWTDLGNCSQTTVNTYCQPSYSLRKEVCGLVKGEGKEKQDPRLPNCSIPQDCMPQFLLLLLWQKKSLQS